MAVSKDVLNFLDYIPKGIYHDYWLSLIAMSQNSIEYINEITFYYRQHSANVVGLHKRSILSQIKKWIMHLKNIEFVRNQRVEQMEILSQLAVNEVKEEIMTCMNFWKDLQSISYNNRKNGFIIILKNYYNGNYNNYYTGGAGMARDILSLFLYK